MPNEKNYTNKEILEKIIKIFEKNNIKYEINADAKNKFINNKITLGNQPLQISHSEYKNPNKLCSIINKELIYMNAYVTRDKYNTLFVYTGKNKSVYKEDVLELPGEKELFNNDDLLTILNNTDYSHIYLTSDWHLYKNHYKHETNYVNTQKIITWCRQNIKDTDVFMYLGDICFRYCNEDDQKKVIKIFNSLPGIKVLIAGNHDLMLGDDFINKCGFDYVFTKYEYKNFIFTHRPILMHQYPIGYWNIHGHIHNIRSYNESDGSRNINVYPMFYDNKPVTLKYIDSHKEELVKDNYWNNNAMLSEAKRSSLPDSVFGIPEDRKYPLDTKKHVKSAIKLFGHAEESKKKQLAKNIYTAAKKYGIDIPETTQCYKYLQESGISNIIPSDINTIIFDFGDVLVSSDLHSIFHNGLPVSHLMAHEIEDVLYEQIFHADKEIRYKLKNYSINEIKEYFLKIAPDNIKTFTDKIFELLGQALYRLQYVNELLAMLKRKGYMIYYLSNWDRWSYESNKEFFNNLTKEFDGGLFSFESEYEKPETEIYMELIEKYKLEPEKCFFFDDKAENIIAAEHVGIRGLLFNKKETYKELLQDNFNIPSNINNLVLINTGVNLEFVNINKAKWLYCNIHEGLRFYFNSLEAAIKDHIEFYKGKGKPLKDYRIYDVDICNTDEDPGLYDLGKVFLLEDGSYEWIYQNPLIEENGKYYTNISEWNMASYNPIQGIVKPYIVKLYGKSGMFGDIKYAFSPDIISDKYLVINEDAKLEIVDSSKFKDYYIEIYEYIGNKARLNKINEYYKNGKIVDNTIFYTTLTGKPMLCEDQIDFDNNFKKVDFDLLNESIISSIASLKEQYFNLYNIKSSLSINESYHNYPQYLSKYNSIMVKQDLEGYYFYDRFTKKRSSSKSSMESLTENMILSILK